ncbi:MAG: hypothetical protein ACRD2O_15815 [Terriglobia bacterium]
MLRAQMRPCWWFLLLGIGIIPGCLLAQTITARGHVTLVPLEKKGRAPAHSNVVVWLTPLQETAASLDRLDGPRPGRFRLVQKNKRFTPHLLVIPAGSTVEFPNHDPFFHNVFSLFNGKRFDLGLYEAGSTRQVKFNVPGICYIFCNIHPKMSAVVIVMKTPYYAIANDAGEIVVSGVPPGRYRLHVWDEHCLPNTLKNLSRDVLISSSGPSLGELRLPVSGDLLSNHKNLYGQDYDPNASSYPNYDPQ